MVRYISQVTSWPDFRWNSASRLCPLGKARQAQGKLPGETEYFELEIQADLLTEEAFTTTAIEGERRDSAFGQRGAEDPEQDQSIVEYRKPQSERALTEGDQPAL